MERYRTAAAFKMAVEAHLAQNARHAGVSIQRLRKTLLFERLLARLHAVAPDRWLLKGALALEFRFGAGARATNDMDLARADDAVNATDDLMLAAVYDLSDYFTFIIQQTDRLDALEDAVAIRYHIRADLAGRLFESAVLDIGFISPDHWQSEPLKIPNLLAFAAFPALSVPALPLATHVAEKLHAYTRGYSDGTRRSTREKDLVDLVLIARYCSFDGHVLRRALEGTFAMRARQLLPTRVPPPPALWGSKYRQQAAPVGAVPDVQQGHARVAAFLDPILANEAFAGHWDHTTQRWSMREEDEAPHGALDG